MCSESDADRAASRAYRWLRVAKVFLAVVASALSVLRLLGHL